ncbi:MAG: two-component system, NarL family, response regulator LiaR [Abditibacteriota bacterium]|nr:two-component system, NarL family, response regulator LiaR [Abditibacteriota bacterium]
MIRYDKCHVVARLDGNAASKYFISLLMAQCISVVIVDDHFVVRQGVRAFLETQDGLIVVGEASDGEAGVQLVTQLRPDVVLMDLVMPILNGVEATRRIKDASPQTQVIILTSFLESEYVLPAVRSGALSYLLKDASSAELLDAIHKAARGEAVLHPQVTARIVHALRSLAPHSETYAPQQPAPQKYAAQQHSAPRNPAALSERELEVLQWIAQGLANHDIAIRLFISEKTVKSHVSSILAKLEVSDRTQAAVFAWRHGLVRDHQ